MNPLGSLPRLSSSARRALAVTGALACANAAALIVQAWALASALAAVVTTGTAAVQQELVVLAVAILARAVLGWATEAVSARAAAGAKEELRAALLDAALHLGPEWIQRRGAAVLTSLATKGLDALDAYFTRYLPALVTAAVVPPLIGAWILFSDPISAVLVLVTVPLIPLFAWLVGRYTEQRTARATDTLQRLSGHLHELVRALPVLTAFGRARAQGETVSRVSDAHRKATVSTMRIAFLSAFVLELLASLSVALVAVGIGLRLVSGELDLATGLLVLILAPECYMPLRAAGAAHHASEDGVEAVRRVDEVLDQVDAREDTDSVAVPEEFVLRAEDVRVREEAEATQFTARRGEIVRLQGASGSGKSSTFAALLGFVEPTEGRFVLRTSTGSRVDIATVEREQWRRTVAWIPQRPAFTGSTVADELDVALAEQTEVDSTAREQVLREVGGAHLRDRAIDTLSTGERQRVAVARALLRLHGRAVLLLCDEPTAHLDASYAALVDAAIRRAADHGAMVVLASHRPDIEPAAAPPVALGEARDEVEPPHTTGRLRELVTGRTVLGIGLGALSLLAGVALTATAAWLIARASQQPPVLALSVAAVGVRTFAISRAVVRYVERLVTHDAAFRHSGTLRRRLWDALVTLGPVRTARLHRGDGVARLVDDVDTVRDLVPRVLVPPAVAGVVAVAAIGVQTVVLPEAGIALGVSLAVAAVAAPVAALAAERRASAAVAEGRREVATRVLGLLDGAAELVAFGADRERRASLATADERLATRARRAATGSGVAGAVVTLAIGAAVVAGAWFAAQAVAAGRLAPELAPLLGLVPLAAAEAMGALPLAAQQWTPLRTAHGRVASLLAEPARPTGKPPVGPELVLDGVDLRWPGAAEPTLREVSCRIPEGSHVAIVGPSGGGKSTLLAHLLGFLEADRGRTEVPGSVSWCPQEPQLVSTTIRENLRLADPTADDERCAEALRTAGLPDFADRLDDVLGASGATVSGGEAQRIALARALLPEARVLLLDEPTAHLDVPTSEALLSRLRHDLGDTTVLHITHRPSEAVDADLVLRVTDNRVLTDAEESDVTPVERLPARSWTSAEL